MFLEAFGFITNLWDPPQILIFNHIYIAAVILTALVFAFIDRDKKDGQALLIGILVFMISATGSLILFYVNPTGGYDAVFLGCGIVIFATILFASLLKSEVRYLEERKKTELYRELAYHDMPTGLENRTAFDRRIKFIRENGNPKTFVQLAILDVNRLKQVNDEIGHYAGDAMILSAANTIKEAFSKYGNVYRIGGDEFAVIFIDQKGRMQECMESFDTLLADANKGRTSIRISVAKGYEERMWTKQKHFMRDLFRDADKAMYADKQRCHAEIADEGVIKKESDE